MSGQGDAGSQEHGVSAPAGTLSEPGQPVRPLAKPVTLDSSRLADGLEEEKSPSGGHALVSILGPAFVAAVAYVDPGNVAANITSGARYGYLLVWVLVLANAMSVLIQYQSAKLGIVTGKSLPQILGERLSDAGRYMFFMQAEVIAIATDLAEVIGGAIALKLLFDLPLFLGGCIIGLVSTILLWFQGGKTHRMFEMVVIALLLVITFGFIAGLFVDPPDGMAVVQGLIPRFRDTGSVLMATSILGATVMPHAIYLHSTLVNDHYAKGERKPSIKRQLKGSKIDVVWALLLAGSVNLALLVLAANSLYGMEGTDSIEGAQHAIATVLGPTVGVIFSVGLLASSLSSTSVGTYAGSEIMRGLLHVKAPMWACRVVTLVPALVVLWFSTNPTYALIVGQVVLSIGIPFAIIPLMRYTRDKGLMGQYRDGMVKHLIFILVAVLIVALNIMLVYLTVTGQA
ncbi:divalent metal cation transporter [Bifidobacterium aemilianum]|uniref:Divalent metal cation transporter n=1 Tax=Bifidobacterium aemilianum TaxID=2493120 RepID=A0A366K854_9BIFI|nr:divalent metal cation transporter [Bifidobacterium aemilianum]